MPLPTSKFFYVVITCDSIQIQASANVSLGAFREDYLQPERPNVNLRRNYLQLFDSMKSEIVRLDVTIGVSLLDRAEQDKLTAKLDKVQPNIPNAVSAGVAQTAMNMQQFAAPKPKPQSELENLDPNKVIRLNTVPVAQPKQLVTSKPVEKEHPVEEMRRLNTNSSLSHSQLPHQQSHD